MIRWPSLLAAWLCASPAFAFDQASTLTTAAPAPEPFAVQVVAAADGGHWTVTEHRDAIHSIDRYAADGSLRSRQFEVRVGTDTGGDWSSLRLQALPDGSLVGYNRRCRLVRVEASGSLRWESSEEPRELPCNNVAANASGAFWLSVRDGNRTGLTRRDHSGRHRGRREELIRDFTMHSNVLAASGEGAYVGGEGLLDGRPAAGVARVDANASSGWSWRSSAEGSRITRLVARPAGGVHAVGRDAQGSLYVAAVDPVGSGVRQRSVPGYSGNAVRAIATGADDSLLVLTHREPPGSARTIVVLDGASQVRASVDLAAGQSCVRDDRDCALAVYPNGDFAMLVESDSGTRLRRWSATGTPLRDVALPFPDLDQDEAAAGEGWLALHQRRLYRIEPDGTMREALLASSQAALAPRLIAWQESFSETVLLFASAGGSTVQVRNPDGSLRWERSLAPGLADAAPRGYVPDALQIVGVSIVCLHAPRLPPREPAVQCLQLSDGASMLEVSGAADLPPLWGTFTNRNVLWLDRVNGSLVMRRWSFNEERELDALVLPPLRSEGLRLATGFPHQQRMAVLGVRADTGQPVAALFDLNDQLTREIGIARLPEHAVHEDGLLLMFHATTAGSQTALDVQAIRPHDARLGPMLRVAESVVPGWQVRTTSRGDVFVAVSGILDGSRESTRILGADLINSTALGQPRLLPMPAASLDALALEFLGDQLYLTEQRGGARVLHVYDRFNLNLLDRRSLPCPGLSCRDPGSPLRSVFQALASYSEVYDPAGGRRLMRLAQTVPPGPAVRADQPGIAGTWYQPATSGQGFVLSYDSATRTLFAPWFTYADGADREGESAQRWYSLQGQVAIDARVVTLQLLRNRGGRFATPPITQAEVVGSAELRFHSCDAATLSYRFNAGVEGARAGTQALSRLGLRAMPCLLNGSTQAAQVNAADAGGFGTRQSGAWYEPVSSGQGLMLDVRPAGGGDAGLLFAAWFTYDPFEPGDDPDRQDWLVLQGPLAGASGGRVTLPILRVTGGSLDADATANLVAIGSAELRFDGCSRLTLDYRFDSSEAAAAHAGRAGTLPLERIGGCGP